MSWAKRKANALLKRLAEEQRLTFKRGHTLISQLVAAGEHDLFVDGYVQNAVQLKAAKAPVDLAFTNPTLVKPPSALGIASKAPHPYAAALMVDFYLSKEAQEILAQKLGYWTVHERCPVATGIAQRPPRCAATGMGQKIQPAGPGL